MSGVAAAIGGAALIGGGVSLYNAKKAREANKGQSIDTSKEILGNFNAYTDESGVKKEMSKFNDLSNLFGSEAKRSYLDTTEGKSFSSMIDKASKKKRDKLRQDSSMMGMTSESYLAGLNGINEQEGSSMNQLVSGADARRMNLRSQQMQALSQVLGGEQGLLQGQQNRFAQSYGIGGQIAGNAANAQAMSNQNAMNMLGTFANAGLQYAGAGGFGGGGTAAGGVPSNPSQSQSYGKGW